MSSPAKPRIRPPALQPGDAVGIVAPASEFKRDAFASGCKAIERLGYKPVYSDSIFEKDIYFAGSVERRIRELEDMFTRPEVRAILCARGGYGCNYLLPHLDLEKIKANPKIFMGYSDLTSLLNYISDSTGLITFHGPMVSKDFAQPEGVDVSCWNWAVNGKGPRITTFDAASGVVPMIEGAAEGSLYGGCLSMLAASLGTPYSINTEGTILFIEDVNTKPYQVDRMLMQLKLAGRFKAVRGIIFGEMLNCEAAPGSGYTLQDVIKRVVSDLKIPVVFGLRSGHVSRGNLTLPIGAQATLNVAKDVQLAIEPPTRGAQAGAA